MKNDKTIKRLNPIFIVPSLNIPLSNHPLISPLPEHTQNEMIIHPLPGKKNLQGIYIYIYSIIRIFCATRKEGLSTVRAV